MSPIRIVSIVGLLILALVLCAGCTQSAPVVTPESTPSGTPVPIVTTATATPTPEETVSPAATLVGGKKVRLETSMGNIVIALSPEKPNTTRNFETLVEKGFYNGVIFHRVIDGFMIQGGDPTGTGRGGPGYLIDDEFTGTNKNNRGTVAMANTGFPNTGGSQFFINTVDNNYLDSMHPVFGTVTEGMDVVDAITKVETNGHPYYRPLANVTILRATMI